MTATSTLLVAWLMATSIAQIDPPAEPAAPATQELPPVVEEPVAPEETTTVVEPVVEERPPAVAPPGDVAQPVAEVAADPLAELSLEQLLEITIPFQSEVEVTAATKSVVQTAAAPSVITVLPRAVLLARGYRTVGEALAGVPGLHVIDDLVTANVGIRGIAGGADSWSRLLKVMVDGQAVTQYTSGGTLLGPELIPINAIEAIEVIRGPGSALYGANAFLGVVNIVTRKAHDSRLELGGEVGLIRDRPAAGAELFGSATSGGDRPRSIVVALSGAALDRRGLAAPATNDFAERWAGLRSERDRAQPLSLFGKGTWHAGPVGELELLLLHQRLDANATFSELSVLAPNNRLAQGNSVARLGYRRAFLDERLQLRAFGALTFAESLPQQRLDIGELTYVLRRARRNRATQVGAELSYRFASSSLLAGVDYLADRDFGERLYQESKSDGARTLRSRGQAFRYSDLGLYAQGIIYPLDELGLTGGLRFDRNDRWENALNGRLALVWTPLETAALKALFGTSFLPPSPSQLYGAPVRVGGVIGNPELDSQTARTAELSGSYRPAEWVSLQLTGYWTGIDRRIEPVNVGAYLEPRNLTTSNTAGLEATAELKVRDLFAEASFAWQWTRIDTPDDPPSWWQVVYAPDAPGGERPPAFPVWLGQLVAGGAWPAAHLQASATLRVVGPRKSSQANIVRQGEAYLLDPYATLDAHLRTLDLQLFGAYPTELSLHAQNLLGTEYAEAGFAGVDMPALGRAVYVRLVQGF